jgi:hypothetical protein
MGLCLSESLEGIGPDRFGIAPAGRQRFTVQIHRVAALGGFVLEAMIPASHPDRQVLVARGWAAQGSRGGRYFHRDFSSADAAVDGVVDALSAVYGTVGDENGWSVVATVQHGDPAWIGGIWSGDESTIAGLTTAPAEGRSVSRPIAALVGAVDGLGSAGFVLYSFVSVQGWGVDPLPTMAIVVGCPVVAMAVSLSPFPQTLGRGGAYLWGDGVGSWLFFAAAFSFIGAFFYGAAIVSNFGTSPPGS